MKTLDANNRMRVVVLDDDQLDLRAASTCLKPDFDLQSFSRSQQLLDYLENETAHLVLLSAVLTEDYSLSVLTDIRSRWPMLPIILTLPDCCQIQSLNEYYKMLAWDTYKKPFDSQRLMQQLETVVNNGSVFQSASQTVNDTTKSSPR